MTRISAAQRVKVQDRAEVEIMRFAHDHALWHKHVHNVALTLKLYRLVAWSGGLRDPRNGEFLPVVVPR